VSVHAAYSEDGIQHALVDDAALQSLRFIFIDQ